jgi:hypothetical protein
MWWAGTVAKPHQAIRDRWRAVLHLILKLPTQMAIPLHTGIHSSNSWSLQCGVLEGNPPESTF